MPFFNYNGKTFAENEPVISITNRGLRYGDGIFETMKLKDGALILPAEHFARLWKGLQLLQFSVPKLWSPEKFEEEIFALAEKNKLTSARIRVTIIRGNGGIYDAVNNIPNYIIEATPLPESGGTINTNGIQLCIYKGAAKSIDAFSNLKHNNCLPYFMGGMYAKAQQCNDALVLNSRGNICEATIANMFIIKDGIVFTPALSEGCIAGVMRKWLIEKIREEGFTVNETVVTVDDAMNADEIFLTNSIYNIRRTAALGEKKFTNTITQNIAAVLAEKYVSIFA